MYMYIVERTQIYLTKRETAALDQAVRETGRTRSDLIREAIEQTYLSASDSDSVREALDATAGLWSDRKESGETYVERMRPGNLAARLKDEQTT
jgi:metal-responsive CopG/Arc/MetJ family transcriptional regulator